MPTNPEDYTVGWICAITTEYTVACELLDEEYKKSECPRVDPRIDHNFYTFGKIHEHNVVVACLPKGRYGTSSATTVARDMLRSFPSIRFGLMVGIGGAAGMLKHDIRLGDVVVSSPGPRHGGVINYEFGKAIQEHEFEETGYLLPPPRLLLHAINEIASSHERRGHRITEIVDGMLSNNKRLRGKYGKPDTKDDKLYRSDYVHHKQADGCACEQQGNPSKEPPLSRPERSTYEDDPKIHYGLIASADKLMKDAELRDKLSSRHNILCFEMEAAGLMDSFPCVVIRGICDYSDTHKNDEWQGYAAATAAAYAKELLEVIPGRDARETSPAPQRQSRPSDVQDLVPFEPSHGPYSFHNSPSNSNFQDLHDQHLGFQQSTRYIETPLFASDNIGPSTNPITTDTIGPEGWRQSSTIESRPLKALTSYPHISSNLHAKEGTVFRWTEFKVSEGWEEIFLMVDRGYLVCSPKQGSAVMALLRNCFVSKGLLRYRGPHHPSRKDDKQAFTIAVREGGDCEYLALMVANEEERDRWLRAIVSSGGILLPPC